VLDAYVEDYSRRGKSLAQLRWTIEARIRPNLGQIQLEKLTRHRIETWHAALAEAPRHLRTRRGEDQRYDEPDLSDEGRRQRRNTANRILTILKAALNLAARNHWADSPERWREVAPFKGASVSRLRYLSDVESKRLMNACSGEFKSLVIAALATGARYGELARMRAGDFNADATAVHIGLSKGGRPRHVHLTDEACAFFAQAAAGKDSEALLFPRPDGGQWGHSHQTRLLEVACRAAKITPAISFHILRHTYASRLVMAGVPLAVVAQQLGHASTAMSERYAHLAPSYVSNTVRAAFGTLGIEPSNVLPMERSKTSG
jgi:integrase